MYYEDEAKLEQGKKLSATGKEFFTRLRERDDVSNCFLTFEWNKDFTYAKILGYMKEVAQTSFAEGFMTLEITLMPYWAWKFGISDEGAKEAEKLDGKCCPSKKDNDISCLGAGTLGGKPGSQCETISMACGEVKPEDVKSCAMWSRQNKLLSSISISKIPGLSDKFGGYLAYPIGDKNGEATGFTLQFLKGLEGAGIDNLFHGLN
jgi:hypothetical protein